MKVGDEIYSKVHHTCKGTGVLFEHTTGTVVGINGDILDVEVKHHLFPTYVEIHQVNKKDVYCCEPSKKVNNRISEAIRFWEEIEDGYDNPKG
jgi:hypothetical protein